jgi:putative transposase
LRNGDVRCIARRSIVRCKIIKTRGSFPNDDAALKLLYLAVRNAGMRWRRATDWTAAMGQFAIQFGPRFPGSTR